MLGHVVTADSLVFQLAEQQIGERNWKTLFEFLKTPNPSQPRLLSENANELLVDLCKREVANKTCDPESVNVLTLCCHKPTLVNYFTEGQFIDIIESILDVIKYGPISVKGPAIVCLASHHIPFPSVMRQMGTKILRALVQILDNETGLQNLALSALTLLFKNVPELVMISSVWFKAVLKLIFHENVSIRKQADLFLRGTSVLFEGNDISKNVIFYLTANRL